MKSSRRGYSVSVSLGLNSSTLGAAIIVSVLAMYCLVSSVDAATKKVKSSPDDNDNQLVQKRNGGASSMEWLRNYLLNYYEAKQKASERAASVADNNVGTSRQLPTQSSLGDAVAVAGLALLFVNQLTVALNMPFLLPFMLLPVFLLALAVKLLSNADQNNDMVTQYLRASGPDALSGWNFISQ